MRPAFIRRRCEEEAAQSEAAFEQALNTRDLLGLEGARELKHRIEAHWRERGRKIELHIVGESRGPGLGVVFGLTSDAVNGMPPATTGNEGRKP